MASWKHGNMEVRLLIKKMFIKISSIIIIGWLGRECEEKIESEGFCSGNGKLVIEFSLMFFCIYCN